MMHARFPFMRRLAVVSVAIAMAATSAAQQSVGLVLSGGGAKGVAHIGLIQALEDNDIPIDFITGTSMGAIVGGLYACGYTPAQMMELIESKDFSYWSKGVVNPEYLYFYDRPHPSPRLANINFSSGAAGPTSILPTSIINPLPMNFAFMELFAPHTAQCNGDFDRLFVPFRCVASDVYHKRKIVCSKGSLGDAIRASMTFPLVFEPIQMDSVLVYDGGIYDNFPVDVMRQDFAPDIMIGSDVSGSDRKPNPNDVLQQLEDMIIQNNDYSLPVDEGIKLHIPVQQFGILDFPLCRQIYQIGYDYAMAHMDSIKARISRRTPAATRRLRRQMFCATRPYVRFDSVSVSGATESQNEYLKYIFTKGRTDTFGIAKARDAYFRAITPGRLRNLVPQAHWNDSTGLFSLSLEADVKNKFNFGFGAYITTSTGSQIFLSGGYSTLSFNSFSAEVDAWVGQSYVAGMAHARLSLSTPVPTFLQLQGVVSRLKQYDDAPMFYDDRTSLTSQTQLYARMQYGIALGRRGVGEVSVGAGQVDHRFFNDLVIDPSERDRLSLKLGQLRLRYEYNSLNNIGQPTSGTRIQAVVQGLYGRGDFYPDNRHSLAERYEDMHWVQASFQWLRFVPVARTFALGLEVNAVASTQKLLSTYGATEAMLPAFRPTPSCYNAFNTSLRAPQYFTVGLRPVWMPKGSFQVRGDFHMFQPWRRVEPGDPRVDGRLGAKWGNWFSDRAWFGEVSAGFSLPFAQISAYCGYASSPGHKWNFGLTLGLFFLAPDFI